MRRSLSLAAGGLLLGTAAVWALRSCGAGSSGQEEQQRGVRVLQALPAAAPELAPQDAAERARRQAARDERAAGRGTATLCVRHEATGEVIAYADVWFVDEADLDEAEREELLDFDVAPEPALAELGLHGRSDAAGALPVPVPARKLHVLAQHGTLWNYATFEGEGATELEILLHEDEALVIQTVDARGHPRGGVPVELQSGGWLGTFSMWEGTTDPVSAEVVLPHVRWFLTREGTARGADRFYLGAGFPNEQCDSIPVGPEDVPQSPLKLSLGDVGAVTVQVVDREGRPWTRGGSVSITLPVSHSACFSHPLDDSGRATFSVVEVGTDIRISVHGNDPALQNESLGYPGPARAGQHEELTVVLGRAALAIQGTALDATGAPLSLQELRVDFRQAGVRGFGGTRFTTAEDGTFRATPTYRPGTDLVWNLEVWVADPRDRRGQHALQRASFPVSAAWTEGPWDLGAFSLAEIPLIAAGRVVHENGDPVQGASVSVNPSEKRLAQVSTGTDAAGEFRLHAETGQELLQVRADLPGCDSVVQEVTPGTRGITLVLARKHWRFASVKVLLDEGVDPDAIRVVRDGEERSSLPEDGSFLVVCEAEAVDLALRVLGEAEFLYRQSGVPTFARKEDAVPLEIDLRGKLRRLEFRAVDPDGNPVEYVHLVAWTPGHPAEVVDSTNVFGKAELSTSRASISVALLDEGWRLVSLGECTQGTTVTLQPSYSVLLRTGRVHFPEQPVSLLPVFDFLSTARDPLAEVAGRYVACGEWGLLARSLEVFVPVPGRYRVQWVVQEYALGNHLEEPVAAPVDVEVRDSDRVQEFDVPLLAEDLERGLQRLAERRAAQGGD